MLQSRIFIINKSFNLNLKKFYNIKRNGRTFSNTPQYYAIQTTMNIFDRNAKKLQKERAARNPDVHLYDYLKEEVGYRLSDRIYDIKREFKEVVDIGCSRGYISRHILADKVQHLVICDNSPSMLEQAEGTPGLNLTKLEVDEENLNFEADSLDLVISNLSLHWVNDLPGCFKKIINSLRPDRVFMASLFGGETLFELRSAFQLAELERQGGISPHVSPFTKIRDVGALLNQAGYTMLTIDTDEIIVNYPSMFELMWDLKGMGENNATFSRAAHLNRETLMAASAIYKELYGNDDKIPATFQVIYFVAWKPGENQPQPLPRGTGEISLKDLGTLFEAGGKYEKRDK